MHLCEGGVDLVMVDDPSSLSVCTHLEPARFGDSCCLADLGLVDQLYSLDMLRRLPPRRWCGWLLFAGCGYHNTNQRVGTAHCIEALSNDSTQ